MTVNTTLPLVEYTGDGATTIFAYPFHIIRPGQIAVFLNDSNTAEGSGYTVSGAGNDNGGSVTFTVAPTNGQNVRLERDTTIQRTVDWQTGGELAATILNQDNDEQVMAIQELDRKSFQETPDGTLDAESRIIRNLSNPTGAQDAATKAFVQSEDAGLLTAVSAAQTAAETAQTAAELAKTNAETAETNSETAQTAAELAETNAETAETNSATSATNSSTSATASAASAASSAASAARVFLTKTSSYTMVAGDRISVEALGSPIGSPITTVDITLPTSVLVGEEFIIHNASTSTKVVQIDPTTHSIKAPEDTVTSGDTLVLATGDTAHLVVVTGSPQTIGILEVV